MKGQAGNEIAGFQNELPNKYLRKIIHHFSLNFEVSTMTTTRYNTGIQNPYLCHAADIYISNEAVYRTTLFGTAWEPRLSTSMADGTPSCPANRVTSFEY